MQYCCNTKDDHHEDVIRPLVQPRAEDKCKLADAKLVLPHLEPAYVR